MLNEGTAQFTSVQDRQQQEIENLEAQNKRLQEEMEAVRMEYEQIKLEDDRNRGSYGEQELLAQRL